MQTEDLIRALASDARPVPRHAVECRVGIGLASGGIVTLAAIAAALGFRPDLGVAMQAFPFWMKWAYTLSLGIGAIAATLHLARPDAARAPRLWLLALPFGLLLAAAVSELIRTPVDGWQRLWLGHSWTRCSMLVASLSVPLFVGLLWAFRRLAPTRLRLAGAMAGLASGACSATLYGLHCPEASATFVLTWYTLGMVLATLSGALIGPRFLRW
ncbi:DUF1109 domain-containing protein [Sphingobium sp.]|uniref:DUF1109 domain-containing protein n=1 Tax=Sphingobium TaxID=165695 RepID=UPI001A32A473|nr:DUF1109 domain-containing protein [Sphingobium sp.]MBJ7376075.1 DUF1109 domain-containing protein [Sphingobium sp.]